MSITIATSGRKVPTVKSCVRKYGFMVRHGTYCTLHIAVNLSEEVLVTDAGMFDDLWRVFDGLTKGEKDKVFLDRNFEHLR